MMHVAHRAVLTAALAGRRCVALSAAAAARDLERAAAAGPRVEISFAAAARAEPVTGMVYLAISRDNQTAARSSRPTRRRAALLDVSSSSCGPAPRRRSTRGDRGHPVASLRDIPAGDYWVQPFVNVYTRFPRADGHTVWLHMDQWEGQNWKRSPGQPLRRAGEDARSIPRRATPIKLVADKVIPPDHGAGRHRSGQADQDPEPDPDEVVGTADLPRRHDPAAEGLRRRIPTSTIRSTTSRDTSRSARPAASAAAATSTSSGSPTTRRGSSTSRCSTRRRTTTIRTAVNSENNGPYGDAIMQELLPAIETQFRVIRQPWARMLSGGSTGGWIALAHQVFYPDFYGGAFAQLPRLGRLQLPPDRQHLQGSRTPTSSTTAG